MPKYIYLILFLAPVLLWGQDIKKVTDKKLKETYYVLKSDKSVKHGLYQKLGYNDKVLVNGNYANGKKVGIWEFYNDKGIEQKYDFTKNELVFYQVNSENKDKKYRMVSGFDTVEALLERPPIYIGGNALMYEVFSTIQYPVFARENGISGIVIVSFIIDKSGKAINHRIKTSVGYGCDEEAMRVVKEIRDNWLPGRLNNQEVEVEYLIPVIFRLN